MYYEAGTEKDGTMNLIETLAIDDLFISTLIINCS